MTETTDPGPSDPSGPSAMDEGSTPAGGSEQLLDGGSTGTDEGPAGLPASLVGEDRDGDPVDAPPAARPGGLDTTSTGPAEEADPLSPSDTSTPSQVSAGRGDSAAGSPLGEGRG